MSGWLMRLQAVPHGHAQLSALTGSLRAPVLVQYKRDLSCMRLGQSCDYYEAPKGS